MNNHQNHVKLRTSIASNHQNHVQLKASIAEFVGPICKRLNQLQEKVHMNPDLVNPDLVKLIDQISTDVKKTNDIVVSRRNWDWKLTRDFGQIERQLDYWVDHNDRMTKRDECAVWTDLMEVQKQLSQNLEVKLLEPGTKPHEKSSDSPQKGTIPEIGESSNTSNEENGGSMLLEYLKSLNPLLRKYLYSLTIFAEKTVLKKRLVIYWWIGLGLVPFEGHRSSTAEQFGEIFFSDLVDDGILIPVHTRKHNQVIDRCTIEPTFHKQLFSICEKHGYNISKQAKEGTWHFFDSKALLNLNQRYLNSKDISDKSNFHVVQLGSWRYTETKFNDGVKETRSKETKPKDHIEVDETNFLKKLGGQVTYLSLRGISGIEELPESTGKLENLMILDLRACHNLEKLSQKPRSRLKNLIKWALPKERWFNKLKVLDISECYLLNHMPKWMCELSNLEVLKGFVVGSEGNKNLSCRLSDLSKLNNLKKLTIRIGREHLVTDDFSGLKSLHRLLVLTITWGDKKSSSLIPANCFPKNLEKLDIRCYPENEASELLKPAELKNLKKLYIRGGKLAKIPCNESWNVEILRLRFLKNLEYPCWEELSHAFSSLKYVEYVECPGLKNFPNDRISWSKEKDELSQSANASETSN